MVKGLLAVKISSGQCLQTGPECLLGRSYLGHCPHSGATLGSGVSGSGSGRVLREAAVSGRSQAVRDLRAIYDLWLELVIYMKIEQSGEKRVKRNSSCVKRRVTFNVSYLSESYVSSSFQIENWIELGFHPKIPGLILVWTTSSLFSLRFFVCSIREE